MLALNCPVCRAPFKEVVREGVSIDLCTECRGVWLDCGELEKLLDIARYKSSRELDYWLDKNASSRQPKDKTKKYN